MVDGEIHGSLLGDAANACTNFLFTPVNNPQNAAENDIIEHINVPEI